mmetsp:Transcript_6614/g.12546  ORF Transcript_6614/g.12546 Transcript_6614/m.12546 type:complete len:824 (+) Transcript_6614:3-2474(+)
MRFIFALQAVRSDDIENNTDNFSKYLTPGPDKRMVDGAMRLIVQGKQAVEKFLPDDKLSVAMSEVENMVDLDTDNHIELMLAEFIKLETLLEDYAGDFDQDLSRTLHMQSTHTLNEWLSRVRHKQLRDISDEAPGHGAVDEVRTEVRRLGERLWTGETSKQVKSILAEFGLGEGEVREENVLFATRLGSNLHGTKLNDPNACYFLVYVAPADALLLEGRPRQKLVEREMSHAVGKLGSEEEAHIHRVECKELQTFLEDLVVGKPQDIELLFQLHSQMIKESPIWRELKSMSRQFLTERCMDGYMHFVKTQIALSKGLTQRLSQIPENGTKEEQQQAAQLSSQISITLSEVFQKLFDLRRIVCLSPPTVSLPTDERALVCSILHGPLTGDLEPSNLELKAWKFVNSLVMMRNEKESAFVSKGLSPRPMDMNLDQLVLWMQSVRRRTITQGGTSEGGILVETMREVPDSAVKISGGAVTTQEWIARHLRALEKVNHVRILHATEVSPHAYGLCTAGNPHQIVCIYIHHARQYFSTKAKKTMMHDVFAAGRTDEAECPTIVIRSFELRHAIKLMTVDHHTTLLESFMSDIVYVDKKGYSNRIKNELSSSLHRPTMAIIWASQALQEHSAVADTEGQTVFHFLSVLRKVLVYEWICTDAKATRNVNVLVDRSTNADRANVPLRDVSIPPLNLKKLLSAEVGHVEDQKQYIMELAMTVKQYMEKQAFNSIPEVEDIKYIEKYISEQLGTVEFRMREVLRKCGKFGGGKAVNAHDAAIARGVTAMSQPTETGGIVHADNYAQDETRMLVDTWDNLQIEILTTQAMFSKS